jgi:chromosome segregation ATPase
MKRKLDKEHIESIQTLRDQYTETTMILGNLTLELESLKLRVNSLTDEQQKLVQKFHDLKRQESELIDNMRARYGDGEINIADGTFTPSGQ